MSTPPTPLQMQDACARGLGVHGRALARLLFPMQDADVLHTFREMCARLGVVPETLASRFTRAGLPSPAEAIRDANLARAAAYFHHHPGASIAEMSTALGYSSPQHFNRHTQARCGVSASAFREAPPYSMATFLGDYVDGNAPLLDALRLLAPRVRP